MTKPITILSVNVDEGTPEYAVIQVPEDHPLANDLVWQIDIDEDDELYELWESIDQHKAVDGSELKLPCHIDKTLTIYTY